MAQSRLAGRLGPVPKGLAKAICPHPHQSSSLLAQRRLLRPRQPSSHLHTVVSEGSLPRVVQPSLWVSLIPKFLCQKTPKDPAKPAKPKSKEWNPATFYIVIFLLIGSQAIQMIALKKELTNFSRRADARIALLKEAVERVQRGEDVDVKALLGTGDQAAEKEWEEVMHELAQENSLRQDKKKKPNKDSAPANTSTETQPPQAPESRSQSTTSTGRAPRGFY
ncbi:MAG: hypothetical protein M1840_000855 [Geoglossum simile]|nr:MAG: hypothetical protein M1840_000855 [Geoglossum simile]